MSRFSLSAAIFLATAIVAAEDKKPEPPKVLLANPLGIAVGATTKVTLRGLRLDGATEIKLPSETFTAKLLSSGKSTPPNGQDAKLAGDTQAEIELTAPADVPAGELELRLLTPAGESEVYKLFVGGDVPVVAEKEGNDGFKQAQELPAPCIVEGQIHGGQNVDVFRVTPPADAKLSAEVFAARRGSACDALLTIYDDKGLLVTQQDDLPDSRDAKVEWQASAGRTYYVVLQDALDQGGPAHPYRLLVR